jgi:hypothetical protein
MSTEPYDWADDENIDMTEVRKRLSALKPVPVTTTPPAPTTAGAIVVLTKELSLGFRRDRFSVGGRSFA